MVVKKPHVGPHIGAASMIPNRRPGLNIAKVTRNIPDSNAATAAHRTRIPNGPYFDSRSAPEAAGLLDDQPANGNPGFSPSPNSKNDAAIPMNGAATSREKAGVHTWNTEVPIDCPNAATLRNDAPSLKFIQNTMLWSWKNSPMESTVAPATAALRARNVVEKSALTTSNPNAKTNCSNSNPTPAM